MEEKYDILKFQNEIEKKWFYIYKEKEKDYFNKKSFILWFLLFFLYELINIIITNFNGKIELILIIFWIAYFNFIDNINKKRQEKWEKLINIWKITAPLFVAIFLTVFSIAIFIILFILSLLFNSFISIGKDEIFIILVVLSNIISIFLVYFLFRNEDLSNYKMITENLSISNIESNEENNLNNIFKKIFYLFYPKKDEVFKINLIKLEKYSDLINKKRKNINNNLKNFEFYKLKNEINYLSKYINKSDKIKEEIKENLISKKYFPKEKFENYLKENIIFPLKEIKKILENNLISIENLKNKTSENPQIILSNKRLEIQKNSLENQILILDEKIKKLEN